MYSLRSKQYPLTTVNSQVRCGCKKIKEEKLVHNTLNLHSTPLDFEFNLRTALAKVEKEGGTIFQKTYFGVKNTNNVQGRFRHDLYQQVRLIAVRIAN